MLFDAMGLKNTTLSLVLAYTTFSLPLVVWAYPLEYTDASTAGQVAGSQHRFTTIRGTSRGSRSVTALATRGPVHVLTVTSSRMLAQAEGIRYGKVGRLRLRPVHLG